MLIRYKDLDLEVEFYEQKEEKEDGFVSLQSFVILESATHKGDSPMYLRLPRSILDDDQIKDIEEIIGAILDEN